MDSATTIPRWGLQTRVRPLPRLLTGEAAAVLVIAAAAAAFRFIGLGTQSLWYDESFTYDLVHRSVGDMLQVLPSTELTPPLYFLAELGLTKVIGTSEAAMRALSALAGVATVPVMFLAVRRLVSVRAGLVAAALVACNPLLIWYSREARSYALLVLLASCTLLAFARLLRPRPSSAAIAAWGVTAFLTCATHYYGTLIVVPEAIWLLWMHRRNWRMWAAVGAAAAASLALLPLAISQRANASWIARYPLDRRLAQLGPQLLLGPGAPERTLLKVLGAVVAVVAVVVLLWRANSVERRGALVGGVLALSALALALLLALAGVDEVITRNLIVGLLGVVVALAAALGARRAGAFGLAGAGALCAIGLVCAVAVMADAAFQRPDWRRVARVLEAPVAGRGPVHVGSSSRAIESPLRTPRVVVIERFWAAQPLNVYLPGLRLLRGGERVRVREFDLIAALGPRHSWFCWWGSECNLKRSRLFTRIRVRGFRPYERATVGQFTVLRLIARRPVTLRTADVFRAMLPSRLDGWAMLVVPQRASRSR